jgi:hypothetical protein
VNKSSGSAYNQRGGDARHNYGYNKGGKTYKKLRHIGGQ